MSLSGHIAPSPPAHSTWFRLEQRRIRDRRAPKKVSCCARRVRMREYSTGSGGSIQHRTGPLPSVLSLR